MFGVDERKRHRSRASLNSAVAIISFFLAVVMALGIVVLPGAGAPTVPNRAHGGGSGIPANPVASVRGESATGTSAQASNSSSVSGIWQTTDGLVFKFNQTGGSSSFSTTVINDSCTGGPRTVFLTGSIENGTDVSGTMYRCSPANSTLDLNCSLSAIWSTPFNATIANGGYLIYGTYQGQFWTWNVTSSGSWIDCHIQSYFNATFDINRIDCGLQTFQQLGNTYIPNATLRAQDVALANQVNSGTKLVWSPDQLAPGGFKSEVATFQRGLLAFNISSTVVSAYRPITYQAHFADMKHCAQWMYNFVKSTPGDAKFLATAVTALNNQVLGTFGTKNSIAYAAGNLTFNIPNKVCSDPPFTECDHVNGIAVDMDLSSPTTPGPTANAIGALFGFCQNVKGDAVHWTYVGADFWSTPKCAATVPPDDEIDITGDSPVNFLVTSPSGQELGVDPSTGTVVNDFPAGAANYSGPGTEPQIFVINSNVTELGNYSVSGIGTGSGPYTITYSVVDPDDTAVDVDGATLYTENVSGTASVGTAITPVLFNLQSSYTPPSPWAQAVPAASTSGFTNFEVLTPNGTFTVAATSSAVDGLLFSSSGQLIALEPTGTGGQTTITIPGGLLSGPFAVRTNSTDPSLLDHRIRVGFHVVLPDADQRIRNHHSGN